MLTSPLSHARIMQQEKYSRNEMQFICFNQSPPLNLSNFPLHTNQLVQNASICCINRGSKAYGVPSTANINTVKYHDYMPHRNDRLRINIIHFENCGSFQTGTNSKHKSLPI